MGLFATLIINNTQQNSIECHFAVSRFVIVILRIVMLSIVMLSVVMLLLC
jgi:hypothetical protein